MDDEKNKSQAAPAAQPTPDHIAGVSKMVPVLYHLDNGKVAAAMLVAKNALVVDLMSGDGPSVVGRDGWFEAGYVATYGGLVPEAADEGTEPGQWSYGVRQLPQFLAPAAPPTPAAPVTDAEIEAAISALLGAHRIDCLSATQPFPDGFLADKRRAIHALIARRVASAGAAPVDQDAKLRELRKLAEVMPSGLIITVEQVKATLLDEIDRLLAAPAASAIAAAPEAPAWREKLDAAAAHMGGDHGYAASRALRGFVLALREQVESHARRIEALERAAQGGGK